MRILRVKLTTHEAILREWVSTVSYDLPLRNKSGVDGIGALVTDAGASTAMVSRFEQRHIRVVIAG
jgi:hypothetical protein